MSTSIVSPSALPEPVVLIDARSGPGGAQAHREGHLSGAIHVDLEVDLSGDTSNPRVGGRHPLPTLDAWAATLGRLGIGADSDVVVYDDKGGANAAARFWWMLRSVGHTKVRVLDGGIDAATRAGLAVETGDVTAVPAAPYPAPPEWTWPTVDADHVAARARDAAWKLIDVRSQPRHRGETEPIDPVAGHIPGADNIFFGENLAADGSFLSAEALADKYSSYLGDVSPSQLVVSCGSGVTACHTLLALDVAGLDGARLYVGSWSEWCRSNRPKATE